MTKSFLPPPEVFATYPKPNYINPETRGKNTCITAIACGVLSIFFVSLRLIARLRIKRGLGWDDFWILFGLWFGLCFYINIVIGTEVWGYKYHIWDLPPRLYKGAAIIEIAAVLFFLLSTSGVRMSLLSFYLHLVRDAGSVAWKRTIYAFVVVTVMLSLGFGSTAVFRCTPVSAYWTYPMPKDARCFDGSVITLIGGILVVVADLCTMLLPLPVVLSFNMPLRQRVSVAVLLSLGIVVTAVSTTRTIYLWKSLLGSYDITWESHSLLICGSVEILLSIICACLPSIKPLYEKLCNELSHHRNSLLSYLNQTSTTCTTATTSKPHLSSKQATSQTPDRSNASINKGASQARYPPFFTSTSVKGNTARMSEEDNLPESPGSWVGESAGWSGGYFTPMTTMAAVAASGFSKKAGGQVEWNEIDPDSEMQREGSETRITVVKSVDVDYSDA